jgi:hypothetical protein
MSNRTTGSGAFSKTSEATTPKGKKTAKETSQQLLAANPARVEFTVSNPSSKEVWLSLGETATKEEGIWLKKEGGAYTNTSYTGRVDIVTTEGEGVVAFSEV